MLMGASMHEPINIARKGYCGLTKSQLLMATFGNALITFIVLFWLTNQKSKERQCPCAPNYYEQE